MADSTSSCVVPRRTRLLHAWCPGCQDEAVHQAEIDGEVYWTAAGWNDPVRGVRDEPHEICIEYCPFCGEELSEHSETGSPEQPS